MNDKVRMVSCPTCGKPVAWQVESRWRPFCSARCRQIDLGAWASETYRIAGQVSDEEAGDIDFQPPGLGEGRRR